MRGASINVPELKARFGEEVVAHLARWDASNPPPAPPAAEQVAREVNIGQVTFDPADIANFLDEAAKNHRENLYLRLSTPALARWVAECATHAERRQQFAAAVERCRRAYCDRVLFDGEPAILALQSFADWRDASEPQPEN